MENELDQGPKETLSEKIFTDQAQLSEKQDTKASRPIDGSRTLAGSIILAAILVSASIFYNGNLIASRLSGGQVLGTETEDSPSPSASVTNRKDQPVLGNANAKVTIIEFADFQCPFCQSFFQSTFGQIKSKYIDTGKIKYVFRHFPLPNHNNAQISSVAAECANQQNKFWEYHDFLWTNGKSDGTGLASQDLKRYADSLGLNQGILGFSKDKFNQCLDSNSTLETVTGDLEEGSHAGVSGTPTFFINGKKVVGAQPFAVFEQAIEAALKQ